VTGGSTHRRTALDTSSLVVIAAVVVAAATVLWAQHGWFGEDDGSRVSARNAPYDGQFTFVRVRYDTAPGGYWLRGLPAWAHGYPIAEQNLMHIVNEVSLIRARVDATNVLSLTDPQLFSYPIVYVTEAGWWTLDDGEAGALRAYLEKGGFVIVDDFKVAGWRGYGGGWEPFERNMRRVMPDAQFIDMDFSHPIFHSFFEIASLDDFPQAYNSGQPIFRGLFEDNDVSKRLMMIVNYNTDISQYWEWSGRGFRPFDETNEAYKLAVNYLIYAMTH
jgi:hypothetical protein